MVAAVDSLSIEQACDAVRLCKHLIGNYSFQGPGRSWRTGTQADRCNIVTVVVTNLVQFINKSLRQSSLKSFHLDECCRLADGAIALVKRAEEEFTHEDDERELEWDARGEMQAEDHQSNQMEKLIWKPFDEKHKLELERKAKLDNMRKDKGRSYVFSRAQYQDRKSFIGQSKLMMRMIITAMKEHSRRAAVLMWQENMVSAALTDASHACLNSHCSVPSLTLLPF